MTQQNPPQASPAFSLPPAPRRRWLTFVLMVVVFVSGLAVGSGLTFMYIDYRRQQYVAHPEDAPKRFAERLRKTLRLTDEQTRQVQAIIASHWPAFQETRRKTYPLFKEQLDALQAEIGAVLHGDQAQRWNDYVERIRGLWNPPPATAPATG